MSTLYAKILKALSLQCDKYKLILDLNHSDGAFTLSGAESAYSLTDYAIFFTMLISFMTLPLTKVLPFPLSD